MYVALQCIDEYLLGVYNQSSRVYFAVTGKMQERLRGWSSRYKDMSVSIKDMTDSVAGFNSFFLTAHTTKIIVRFFRF